MENKRLLYERIMHNVSKQLSRTLNESALNENIPDSIDKDNNVYLVYEGDNILSSNSMVLMGIYTLYDSAMEAIAFNNRFAPEEFITFDEDDEDDRLLTDSQKNEIMTQEIFDQLSERNYVIGDNLGYQIKTVELNVWDEI